ncbi:hypothetical protein ACJIZ3_020069 [Penstemon smallii]|uniref:Uncharacterized protein n=1 Tax=Penstemon smallii TaxID=265156 RepID=A0ABD3SHU8_9LAMI
MLYIWTMEATLYQNQSCIFIPVLNHYYICHPSTRGTQIKDTKNTSDAIEPSKYIFQQVKILRHGLTRYNVKFVACKCFCPYAFLHNQIWWHDSTLRARLPNLNCSLLCKSTKPKPVLVGKWYTPFMFVKEGRVRDQVERSMYYEITLEQRWEQVFTRKKNDESSSSFLLLGTKQCGVRRIYVDDGWILFMSYETEGGDLSVGLRVEVVQRMKWEQERGGWKKGKDWKENRDWIEFGCYVLVERFNFRRMDGSLAMAYDFKHTHQIKTIWE